jgi:5-methylcytosine-specific restriction endonuclease McrA
VDAKTKQKIIDAASAKGLEVKFRGSNGTHVQIIGPLLCNYYPDAKKRSAYVAGTTQRKNHVTPEEAVEMALKPPVLRPAQRKDSRWMSGNTRQRRQIVFRLRHQYGDNCHWCKLPMVFKGDGPDRVTIEHVIPLDRGGLDNENNMRLAHRHCNNKRGSNMPELEG